MSGRIPSWVRSRRRSRSGSSRAPCCDRRDRAHRRGRYRQNDPHQGDARRARPGKPKACYLNNPTLTRSEFLEFLAANSTAVEGRRLENPIAPGPRGRVLECCRPASRRRSSSTRPSLPDDLLEEVRLLANIETTTEKLLPIVLAGQPELAERLNQQSLRQLKQRVGLRCSLKPLDLGETGHVHHRPGARGRGTASTMFTREAVCMIHERSRASAHHQRHLPQRADQLVRAGSPAGDGTSWWKCAAISTWVRPSRPSRTVSAGRAGPDRGRTSAAVATPGGRAAANPAARHVWGNFETETLVFVF